MGHNLEQLGSASLDVWGGLSTYINAADMPEGSSPRNWDVDFFIGSVQTRPGLSSVYSYASSLNITMLQVGSGSIGTFSYNGGTPTVNEGFVLQGFSGSAQSLNGQTIFVIYVNAIAGTFTADVVIPAGTYVNLIGTAVSIVGQFLGPNIPTIAVSVALSGGNAWQTPNNVMGNVGYATVSSGATVVAPQVPTQAGSLPIGGAAVWSNPGNITATGATVASLTISAGQTQDPVVAARGTLSIPADAVVTGVAVSITAHSSVTGTSSLNLQLSDGTTDIPFGTAVNVPLGTVSNVYLKGSASYQWGTTLTPAMFTGNHLAVQVTAAVSSGTATISANSLVMTVYYTLAGSSQILQTTGYVFSAPSTAGVTGFGVTFQAFTTATNTLSVQLLKNGIAVGQPKTLALTTIPTIYSLGAASDLWGSTWTYADINNTSFGVDIIASDSGTASINDLDVLAYITPAQVNFNYVKSYIQNDGQIDTLALDASGLLWKEDVTSAPGVLAVILSGILPGSFAKSATADNNEYIMFSDLAIGTDRPRVYFRGEQFLPLSQGGPGAPPTVVASQSTAGGTLAITSYSSDGTVITFTFTAIAGFTPAVNSLYTIQGTGVAALDNQTFEVTAPVSGTTFTASFVHAAISGTVTATAVPTASYGIVSIVQNGDTPLFTQIGAVPFNGQITVWSAQGEFSTAGTTVRFYYGSANAPENASLVNTINTYGTAYVYIVSAASFPTPTTIGSGTWQVTNHGVAIPGFGEHSPVPWFEINYGQTSPVGGAHWGDSGNTGNTGNWQQTLATLTTTVAVPGLGAGDSLTIQGVNASWDRTWTVLQALNSNVMNISTTSMDANGVATYGYNVTSVPAVQPAAGQEVTITGTTNSTGTPGIFNGVFVISSVNGTDTQFTVAGFVPPAGGIPQASQSGAQATTSGTMFTFDPGQIVPNGSSADTIYGNVTSTTGTVSITNGAFTPIGQGTRQAVVFFITASGYETTPSYPVTFDTLANSNFLTFSGVAIGPPDTVARGIAITEAGQNGVPGANFYVIMQPVVDIVNSQKVTYSSTIINDNTTTSANFTFTDAVLLNSREIDIQGDNLFNLIELGSAAWVVPYVGRNFYGLQLNKIDNWWTGGSLGFDQGYLPAAGGNIQPLGWFSNNTVDQTLIVSSVTGDALYIKNVSGATAPITGMVWQTAYQDYYATAILNPNITYSVRVSAYIPSGITVGNLVIDLTDYVAGTGFGTTYGSFTVPFSSMSTNDQVFTGTLLTVPFLNQVSPNVQLRVYGTNMAAGADLAIDRIEVFETLTPYLKAQVYGSYANQPEAIDASGTGGIIDTTSENAQSCMGAFVMHNLMYLLKTQSWYSTQDNPNSEPGGWGLSEVSNKVGTIGINSYDTGEEWCITACRSGIYGFDGGQPTKISQELWNLWEQINWDAGNTIVLRNDVVSKRLYCAIPLPTGVNPATGLPANKYTNVWLPYAPYNPAPTSPNVVLMLNYQGLADIKEMMMSPGVHTTISKIVLSIAQAWSRIERIQGITHWVNPEPSLARGRCNDYPVGE